MKKEMKEIGNLFNLGYPNYSVNKDGSIFSHIRNKFLKITVKQGYGTVYLSDINKNRKRIFVHKLVTTQFLGPKPQGLEICHIDGNRLNNKLLNLKYATKSENEKDKFRHGTALKYDGENNKNAKLKEFEVKEIIKLHQNKKYTLKELANIYNTSKSNIEAIIYNKSWKKLERNNGKS